MRTLKAAGNTIRSALVYSSQHRAAQCDLIAYYRYGGSLVFEPSQRASFIRGLTSMMKAGVYVLRDRSIGSCSPVTISTVSQIPYYPRLSVFVGASMNCMAN